MAMTRDQMASVIALALPVGRVLPTAGAFDANDQAQFSLLARSLGIAVLPPTPFTGVATPFYLTRIRRI